MEIVYHTVNHEIRPEERGAIVAELDRVVDFVKRFPRPVAHVEVEKSPRKGGFGVSIHVKLSTRALFASSWESDLRSAVELTVDRLVRQVKKHLDRLRENERAGAETTRNSGFYLSPTVADLESARDIEDFRDQISGHAAKLHRVLRRELRLDPRAEQAGGAVSVPDLVEEALAYVFEHFREKPLDMSPDRWLVRRGLIFLDEELDRASGATAGSEAALPPTEIPEDWEDLMDLPVFEPVPLDRRPADASKASPEIRSDRGEAQRATAEALKGLSERHRKSILLRHLEGYEVPEIAYVLNATEDQVDQWLLEGETALQDQLRRWRGI
ncbi:MAG: HPF/RaiA family ribosome-associated protein [Planctomycetota bacterium]